MLLDKILLKVASRCNIDCRYCYVYNQGDTSWQRMPKHMSLETVGSILVRLAELHADQRYPFDLILHGGEPLLLPRSILKTLLEGLADQLPATCTWSIQTNGILIDDDLLDLCFSTGATLSVSLDGPADVHDNFRIGFDGGGTYARAAAGIARIRRHAQADRLFTGALCVIDPCSDASRVYEFFKSLAVPSVDFLFKDGNLEKLPLGKSTIESTEYGCWLAALWDCYVSDPHPPRVRVLDDLGRLLLSGKTYQQRCGETSRGILVIDTDGTITKNDTLKSTYDGADRFTTPWSVDSAPLSKIAASEEFVEHMLLQQPTSSICKSCTLLPVCGGGMPLSRWHSETGFNNPSVYCADYKLVIGRMRGTLREPNDTC